MNPFVRQPLREPPFWKFSDDSELALEGCDDSLEWPVFANGFRISHQSGEQKGTKRKCRRILLVISLLVLSAGRWFTIWLLWCVIQIFSVLYQRRFDWIKNGIRKNYFIGDTFRTSSDLTIDLNIIFTSVITAERFRVRDLTWHSNDRLPFIYNAYGLINMEINRIW